MTVREFIEHLQFLGASSSAKIVVWDDKQREYEITNIDSVLADEIVVDIRRTKTDYKD